MFSIYYDDCHEKLRLPTDYWPNQFPSVITNPCHDGWVGRVVQLAGLWTLEAQDIAATSAPTRGSDIEVAGLVHVQPYAIERDRVLRNVSNIQIDATNVSYIRAAERFW